MSILFFINVFSAIQATEAKIEKIPPIISAANKTKLESITIFFGNTSTNQEQTIPINFLSEEIPQNMYSTIIRELKDIDYIVIKAYDDHNKIHLTGQIGNNSEYSSQNSKEQVEQEVKLLNAINISNSNVTTLLFIGSAEEGFVLSICSNNSFFFFPRKAFIKQ